MAEIGSRPINELIILARNGSGPAFTALWDRYVGQMKSYIKASFRNISDFDTEDIVIRSFEKAFRQIESYDPSKSQFLTWLKTIAKNTALDLLDAENRAHPQGKIEYIDHTENPAAIDIESGNVSPLEEIINDEIQQERLKGIERLPDLYRGVAYKRVIEGMSYKEIAEETGLELNTVKTRIRRAKALAENMIGK